MASWDMENPWLVLLVAVKNRYIMTLRAGKNELKVLNAVRQGRARTGICEGVYHEVQEGKYQLDFSSNLSPGKIPSSAFLLVRVYHLRSSKICLFFDAASAGI